MEILLAAIRDLSDVNMLFKPGVLMISGVSWCHLTSLSFDKMMIFLNQNMIQSNPVSQKWCLFFTFFFSRCFGSQEPLKTKPLLRSAGFRSDSRCSLAELCARPSSEGVTKIWGEIWTLKWLWPGRIISILYHIRSSSIYGTCLYMCFIINCVTVLKV